MTVTDIEPDVLRVLLHTTGAHDCTEKPHLEIGWRNRYCAGPGHYRWDACNRAVVLGLMDQTPDIKWAGRESLFYATDSGLALCRQWLADRLRNRVWDVTVDCDDGPHTIRVIADTRSKAKAHVVRDLRESWCCTWREAVGNIKRCVKVKP